MREGEWRSWLYRGNNDNEEHAESHSSPSFSNDPATVRSYDLAARQSVGRARARLRPFDKLRVVLSTVEGEGAERAEEGPRERPSRGVGRSPTWNGGEGQNRTVD